MEGMSRNGAGHLKLQTRIPARCRSIAAGVVRPRKKDTANATIATHAGKLETDSQRQACRHRRGLPGTALGGHGAPPQPPRGPLPGGVFPVNPKYTEILARKCYPDLESIDPPPDLAILLLNQHLAVDMAEKAGRLGIPGVTIVAGGFREVLAGGEALNERLQRIASQYDMVVIGPNTLGFSTFHHGLHGIFWHMDTIPGPVAIISQSGGVGLTMGYSLRGLQCGLSHFIGVGNRTVVDFPDYLGVLRDDPHAGTFLLFIEGVEDPRSLYEAIKETALKKPVVVYKAGKNEAVSKATATHTGSLAGEYGLYKAMFKQAGAFEAESSWDAAVAAKALSMVRPPRGTRLCALTFTAGPCIVAMDKLVGNGWELPDLRPEAKSKIMAIIGEKTPVEIQNPVDLTDIAMKIEDTP